MMDLMDVMDMMVMDTMDMMDMVGMIDLMDMKINQENMMTNQRAKGMMSLSIASIDHFDLVNLEIVICFSRHQGL